MSNDGSPLKHNFTPPSIPSVRSRSSAADKIAKLPPASAIKSLVVDGNVNQATENKLAVSKKNATAKMRKSKITVRIDHDVYTALEAYAAKHRWTLSGAVGSALEALVKSENFEALSQEGAVIKVIAPKS